MSEREQELKDIASQLEALARRVQDASEGHDNPPSSISSGQRLARARAKAGMTQVELAEVSGVSTNTIVNFENGRTKPRYRTLMALAEPLGIDWMSLDESGG